MSTTKGKSFRITKEEYDDIRNGKPIRPRGLGDTIAKMTKAVGLISCGGCKKRQAKLNAIFPYKPESTT